ncbi:hypothetical protein JMN32_10550 [Fulvivirga sp. 29W222]|uniref:Uncharacterized protein n=1 Tax=Fulvivirga marina TaxID=2494733 RepID=A0A937FYB2_9BACT|nr:hypothetical protein [Fulvivirga marina]MBL6446753.1 hypothetical protein [Fulvivirga marina]
MIKKQKTLLLKILLGKLALLLMVCSNTFAQHIFDDNVKIKDLIRESNTIIKGVRITKVPQYFYLNSDGSDKIFNSVQIEVQEVYKGDIRPGELIEYTIEGGILDGKEYYPDNNGALVGTMEYILILAPSTVDSKFEDSPKVFSPYKPGYSHIMFAESTFSALYKNQQFKTLNDLYDFLDENGLHIAHDKNDPKNQMDPHSYRKQFVKQPKGVKVEKVESSFNTKTLDSVEEKKDPEQFIINTDGKSQKKDFKKKTSKCRKKDN